MTLHNNKIASKDQHSGITRLDSPSELELASRNSLKLFINKKKTTLIGQISQQVHGPVQMKHCGHLKSCTESKYKPYLK